MGDAGLRLDRDQLGIVTERRQDRERFAHYRQHRPLPAPRLPSNLKGIVREMVDEWLKEKNQKRLKALMSAPAPDGLSVEAILAVASEATGYSTGELLGPRRIYPLVRARQLVYHLLRVLRTDMSLPAIGRAMAGRDHSSILAGLRRVDELRLAEPLSSWMAYPAIARLLEGK